MKVLEIGKEHQEWAHVPWGSGDELKDLRDSLFSTTLEVVLSGLTKVEAWEAVYERVSLKILATCQLLRAQLRDPLCTPCQGSIEVLGPLSDPELSSNYSLAVLRATSSMIDPVKKGIPIKMEDVAACQSFPYACTEARHSIVHGQMPSLPHLRIVATECLDFLRATFWNEIVEIYNVTHEKLHKELSTFFHTHNHVARKKARKTNSKPPGPSYKDSSSEEESRIPKGTTSLHGARVRKQRLKIGGSVSTLVNISMETTIAVIIDKFLPARESNGLDVLMANSPTMYTKLAKELIKRLASGKAVNKGWVQWLVDPKRSIHLSSEEMRELLTFVFDKMLQAYSLKSVCLEASPAMRIATALLDNGLAAGQLTGKEVASYLELSQIQQDQSLLVPPITEQSPDNGYLPLSVEESPVAGVVSIEDVTQVEKLEESMRKRCFRVEDGVKIAGAWERVTSWSPCAIGSLHPSQP